MVTDELSGQVSVLRNLGNGTFAPPSPIAPGPVSPRSIPAVRPRSPAWRRLRAWPPGRSRRAVRPSLVAVNPGSNTLDVLAGLGEGRFANPVTFPTAAARPVVRVADFTGNGLDDLAVLTADGVSIYLGNGKGGFLPPTTYAVPPESDGLTVADLTGNGKLDLLVGNAYGDVLVLHGQRQRHVRALPRSRPGRRAGRGRPHRQRLQGRHLRRPGPRSRGRRLRGRQSTVLADQSTGLLDPGAVMLADLNGNGIPDLIVANSGSNNVLIYPGLGNGQFGPGVNDGHGYFTGTDPVGITVADLTGESARPGRRRRRLQRGVDSCSTNLSRAARSRFRRMTYGSMPAATGRCRPWWRTSPAIPIPTFWSPTVSRTMLHFCRQGRSVFQRREPPDLSGRQRSWPDLRCQLQWLTRPGNRQSGLERPDLDL